MKLSSYWDTYICRYITAPPGVSECGGDFSDRSTLSIHRYQVDFVIAFQAVFGFIAKSNSSPNFFLFLKKEKKKKPRDSNTDVA